MLQPGAASDIPPTTCELQSEWVGWGEPVMTTLDAAAIDTELKSLNATPKGLSSAESAARLARFGRNAIVAKTESRWQKLAAYFWGPLPWMIEAAALISLLRRDWPDFCSRRRAADLQRGCWLLAGLQGFQCAGCAEEGVGAEGEGAARWRLDFDRCRRSRAGRRGECYRRADRAGRYSADRRRIPHGRSIGADGRIASRVEEGWRCGLFGRHCQAGRYDRRCRQDRQRHILRPHGKAGRIGWLLSRIRRRRCCRSAISSSWSRLRWRWFWSASKSTARLSLPTPGIGATVGSIAQFVLILLVASIPVALPAVMSVTMAIGAYALSKQRAILSRLSAIEELAGVDVLCSDKTGTLTMNQLSLDADDPVRCI